MHPYAFLMITAFDKLHMFSKSFDCVFGSYARIHQVHRFHAASFVSTLMWLASPWKCPNNGETARLSKRKKDKTSTFNNVTFRVSEARENKLCVRAFSPPVSPRPERARVIFCIVQWAVLLLHPASIIELIQNGLNGSDRLSESESYEWTVRWEWDEHCVCGANFMGSSPRHIRIQK